jgi:hypothetical protein
MQQHRQSLLTLKVELRMDFWKISLPLIRITESLLKIKFKESQNRIVYSIKYNSIAIISDTF